VYRWPGSDAKPLLVLVHGWGDTGETFQFVVDHLPSSRSVVAFDQRGFGRTTRPDDGYWFPDYLADLEALIDALSPTTPIDLVGHSMGGNVAMLYAGIRPERVRRLVNLEAFGMSVTTPGEAPARYREWLDEVKTGSSFTLYDSFEQLMMVLTRRNPRTPRDRLEFVARSWAREREDGRIELWADPKHKRVNPALYQRDQAEVCWRAITAPLLFVVGRQSELVKRNAAQLTDENLHRLFGNVALGWLEETGHMVHHEKPAEVAALIERHLAAPAPHGR
jgi:pimeloyl-ACP methyl ester carboxylesterase